MSAVDADAMHSSLWREVAEPDDPFAARECRLSGYDVYGELLGKASYIQYLYLLMRAERPGAGAAKALEVLAIALANPGPRDASVHAAMATGATGTPAAASLIAALAPGAGSHGGAREVLLSMQAWQQHGCELDNWRAALTAPAPSTRAGIRPEPEHPPGFAPYGVRCATPARQTLALLAALLPDGRCAFLLRRREQLEQASGLPLAMTGVAAAALLDMGFDPEAGEMLTLLLRLPGAAAHALEQRRQGFRQFPFFSLDLQDDPGAPAWKEAA